MGYDWWIFDVTRGDAAPIDTNNLSTWSYPGAAADSDNDGLVDWYELLIHTNPFNPDSDYDGLPDGWEIAHGFNPLNPQDGGADQDHDGLSNAWELAHGGDPFRWSSWPVVRVSPGRLGHHFTLHRGVDDAQEVSFTFTSSGSDVWAESTFEVFDQNTWITDDTAGDALTLSACYWWPLIDATSGDGWTDANAELSHHQHFLIPLANIRDVLILLTDGPRGPIAYPVSTEAYTGPYFWYQWYGSNDLCAASAPYNPGYAYRLIDLTTNQQAADGLNLIYPGAWSENQYSLPVRSVEIKVSAADAGRLFHVRCDPYLANRYRSWQTAPDDGDKVIFGAAIVSGLPFTVIRADDGQLRQMPDTGDTYDLSEIFPGDRAPSPFPPIFKR